MTHVDPVCGMTIEEEDAVGSYTHDGTTYYFCNPSCLERFTADPKSFLAADAGPSKPPASGHRLRVPDAPRSAVRRLQARVRSAAWRSSRAWRRSTIGRIPSWST